MKSIQISEQNALKIYPTADAWLKTALEDTFSKAFFNKSIIERLPTVEDACRLLGIDPDTRYEMCDGDYDEAETDIKIMAEALSEGKGAKDRIHYPYFEKTASGFRLGVAGCDCATSTVGARLKVDSREKALHLGKVCEAQYITTFTTL